MNSSDRYYNFDHHHNQQQQQQENSGLTRYRSAPSSFFAGLFDNNGIGGSSSDGDDYFNNNNNNNTLVKSSESESESIFAPRPPQLVPHQCNGSGNMIYQTPPPPPPQLISTAAASAAVGSSNLVRQSSSPAEFFSGFSVTRASNGTYGETSSSNNHMNFSSVPSSHSRYMPQIAEDENENIGTGSPEKGHLDNDNNANGCYVPSFSNDSWNNSTFSSLKRNRVSDLKMFPSLNALESQNEDSRNYTPGLTHHWSLPKTSSEMVAIEKFLQYQQDSIPCKIRAKRGFATHPRSIAERNRRTRISERMRKLQELFPNMDKQTNTAEMLDLAVEYIKDLQKQLQTLNDTRAKCTCSSKEISPTT